MPDYIYLLENRLSPDQQNALRLLREVARESGMILFLTGDAVRDLTSGHAVRDLEVTVHGNALKLKKPIEKMGGVVWGEDEPSRSLYLCFPGTVRVDLVSTHRTEYPKPGKPVYHPASIQEDLRRRDFTVNAMAISLNEGSFGLLMDPLNGAADIETRHLRLVSNYGFLEEPSLLIRATRYMARLGWEMDERTRTRYGNAREEGVIEFLSAHARSQELEQIGHEDDGLKVLRALEAEGWMKFLFPAWTAAKADEEKLKALHSLAIELLVQGVHADMSAAQMQLLTAKVAAKDLATLKKLMLRPGFVQEWNGLDALASGFAKVLLSKENAAPSACYKLITSYDPEAVLWLGFTSKDATVKERFQLFLKTWPEMRQRIPHALMQEMRITPELATYREIIHKVFLELIDARLNTPEEMRAFLDPHSPPAPPPQAVIKRSRAKRGAEAKAKERSFDDEDEAEDGLDEEEDLDDIGGEDEEIDLGLTIPKIDLEPDLDEEGGLDEKEAESEELEPVPAKAAKKHPAAAKSAKGAAPVAPKEKPAAAKPAKAEQPQSKAKAEAKPASQPAAAKSAGGNGKAKPATGSAPQKTLSTPAAKTAAKTPVKAAAKVAAKVLAKAPAKAAAKAPAKVAAQKQSTTIKKSAPAASPAKKPQPSKPAAKKPATKAGKKR
jgi:tRNA nucleotidyltransferase/poly(A) polymerase